MKVFDLVCVDGHRFEGWFASADAFDVQHASHAVRCPICDADDVKRAPSAPRLNLGGDGSHGPALFARLRRMVAEAEDVGPRFATEARRIHYDETPARSIRGTATQEERQSLEDEGIETFAIPALPALTDTLQ